MNKLLGGTLAIVALAACSANGSNSNPHAVTLTGGAVLYVYYSLAHGGADRQAAALRDSLAHGGADSRVIILTGTNASSTPSNGNTAPTVSCTLTAIHDTSVKAPAVITVEASC
jgi:hypothetical protein